MWYLTCDSSGSSVNAEELSYLKFLFMYNESQNHELPEYVVCGKNLNNPRKLERDTRKKNSNLVNKDKVYYFLSSQVK